MTRQSRMLACDLDRIQSPDEWDAKFPDLSR